MAFSRNHDMSRFQRLREAYGRLLHAFGLVAAISSFLIMILVVANIFGRYFFNSPITGAFEVTESLLVVSIMLALATTQYHDGHIRVTILTRRMPRVWAHFAKVCTLAISIVFFMWCGYASWKFAYESYSFNEQEWGTITFPLYPFKFVVFVGIVLLAVQFAFDMITEIKKPEAAESSVVEGV
jgi:TRAP-type C4-dicarboxylate transport system permease small subunit